MELPFLRFATPAHLSQWVRGLPFQDDGSWKMLKLE